MRNKEAKKKYDREYYQAHKEINRARNKKWREEHKDIVKGYRAKNIEKYLERERENHIKHKEKRNTFNREYNRLHKEELKIYIKGFLKSPAGKSCISKQNAKRKREFGFNPLNSYFKGSEGHHIGREYVIYIPKVLHKSISHSLLKNRNMKEINAVALDYLFTSATT